MRRGRLILAATALTGLAAGAGVAAAALARSEADAGAPKIRQGGTFRIAHFESEAGIDPASVNTVLTASLLEATCAQLMNYPDKQTPAAGLRVVPEVAAGPPRVSNNGKTYTFTIRRGYRFSNGSQVTAQSFGRAIGRALAPSMESYGASFLSDVVGAQRVRDGELPAGVVARGNRLVIRLTRPVPDLTTRLALPFFCAVPPNLPIDPEGVGAPLHSAGPYYVAEFVRGRRIVLRRNPYYRASRPRRVERFEVDLRAASPLDALERVKRGTADWAPFLLRVQFAQLDALARRYGVGKSRLFLKPGQYLVGFYLNTKRGLFRNNTRLRRAVNFAVDRPAILRQVGSHTGGVTDQYLPPGIPGFRDAQLYPLPGPNARRARALARGHRRTRKATFYISDDPTLLPQAQIVKTNLARIGLAVEIKVWPRSVHFTKLSTPGEPWDIGAYGWTADYPDPSQYLNVLFAGDSPFNPAFDSPTYNRLLAQASRKRGAARSRAYRALDVRLARDAAPFVAVHYANEPTLVSSRVDRRCVVQRPRLDLAAVCLKR